MKRLSILSVILLFLFACEGDTGPMGPPGEPGISGESGMNWLIVEYTFKPEDWVLEGEVGIDELNSRWVASYPVPEIKDFIYKNGVIVVYCYPEGRGGLKTPLPYVLHYGVEDESKNFLWTQTLHYTVEEENIHFYLTYSDFATNVSPTDALGVNMDIDIVLLWK